MQKTPEQTILVDAPPSLSSTPADVTLARDGSRSGSLAQTKDEGAEDHSGAVRKLAADQLAAVELRSVAQQNARALRELYKELGETAVSIQASLKDNIWSPSKDMKLINQKIDTLSSLISQIEATRKVFDRSEERISNLEWNMVEAEKRLYARAGAVSPTALPDFTSEKSSDLSSVPLPSPPPPLPPFDEEDNMSEPPQQSLSALRSDPGRVVAADDLTGPQSVLPEMQSIAPNSTLLYEDPGNIREFSPDKYESRNAAGFKNKNTAHNSLPFRMATDQDAQPTTISGQSLRYLITQPANERLKKYATQQSPEESRLTGAQFPDAVNTASKPRAGLTSSIILSPQRIPGQYDIILGISHWLSHGVPWNAYSAQILRHSHIGVSVLQDLMLDSQEAMSLGLPPSIRLGLMKDSGDDDIGATRNPLRDSWLWEPNIELDHRSFAPDAIIDTNTHAQAGNIRSPRASTQEVSGATATVDRMDCLDRGESVSQIDKTAAAGDLNANRSAVVGADDPVDEDSTL